MDALWYGTGDDAFFDFTSISKNRKIKLPYLPDRLSNKVSGNQLKIPPKANGEIRIISLDVALMSSKKNNNDAAAIFVNQMLPTKAGRFINNIIYTEVHEGLTTNNLALVIRKLFEEYLCDYLVIDTQGVGLGVYDQLIYEIVDSENGEVYPAISCINDKIMAERCTVPGARKVIYSVKASAQFNSDCAFLLREAFRSGKVRLLGTEYDADEWLSEVKGYNSLSPSEKMALKMPYIHTTLLVDELTKLQHEENGGKIKVYERSGMRKDRYSSLSYNYYIAVQLEKKAAKKQNLEIDEDSFIIKPPKMTGKVVRTGGRNSRRDWFD